MSKKIIQNEELVENVINNTVQKSAQMVFEQVVGLDKYRHIAEDIAASFSAELMSQSFMTVQLELTEKQKEALLNACIQVVNNCVNKYVSQIKKDERTEETVEIVESLLKNICEEVLSSIAQEINRGAIINSTAVSADTKNEKFNKIELNHSKASGDITIPTRGVFLSTNCIEVIKNSCAVDLSEEVEPAKEDQQ